MKGMEAYPKPILSVTDQGQAEGGAIRSGPEEAV